MMSVWGADGGVSSLVDEGGVRVSVWWGRVMETGREEVLLLLLMRGCYHPGEVAPVNRGRAAQPDKCLFPFSDHDGGSGGSAGCQ